MPVVISFNFCNIFVHEHPQMSFSCTCLIYGDRTGKEVTGVLWVRTTDEAQENEKR
jgi:hypothetical protein